jgi:RecA-family ATPase
MADDTPDSSGVSNFFLRNSEERTEIIEGLLREGDLGAFAGAFGMGKTPTIADLTVRLGYGLDWCGRRLERRPVIVCDCETAGPDYKSAIRNIAIRLNVPVPHVPDDLDVYLERDQLEETGTKALLGAVSQPGHEPKLRLIETALRRKPNAVVFLDPLEMLFRLGELNTAVS